MSILVKFRGFNNENVSESYKNLSKFMKDNAEILYPLKIIR